MRIEMRAQRDELRALGFESEPRRAVLLRLEPFFEFDVPSEPPTTDEEKHQHDAERRRIGEISHRSDQREWQRKREDPNHRYADKNICDQAEAGMAFGRAE